MRATMTIATESGDRRPSMVIAQRRYSRNRRFPPVRRGTWLALCRTMLEPVRSVWVALFSLWVALALALLCAAAFACVVTAATGDRIG
jgi:hypothetical protein